MHPGRNVGGQNRSLRTDSAGGHKRLFASARRHIKDAISERDSC
jgi:hypothetical protein